MKYVKFNSLLGKTIIQVDGLAKGSGDVFIKCSDGTQYQLFHEQDCCEHVSIQDVVGDVGDLIGHPLLVAEECSNDTFVKEFHDSFSYNPESSWKTDSVGNYEPESCTWTFYKLATIKGSVDIRWYGESNGYYSESVSFEQLEGEH